MNFLEALTAADTSLVESWKDENVRMMASSRTMYESDAEAPRTAWVVGTSHDKLG
jgi:hypothetical protein